MIERQQRRTQEEIGERGDVGGVRGPVVVITRDGSPLQNLLSVTDIGDVNPSLPHVTTCTAY